MITFFSQVTNAIGEIIGFFKNLVNLIVITIEFIPQPFLAITITFIPIIFGSLIYKAVRG